MRGGQGEVNIVYDNGEKVACKHPFIWGWDDDSINRFKREIKIVQKIDSPNVIKILESGQDKDGFYYKMPVYKENLEEYLVRNGNLVFGDFKLQQKIILSILSGVKALHEQKIIHRDLKPSNILLNDVDDIVICDFGLSKDLESDSTFTTTTGIAAGTDGYMAPEQLKDVKRVDFRADIYALGVLFNDLIGRNNGYNSPEQLNKIADKATSYNIDDRFGDIAEFISAVNTAYKILLRYEDEALASELLSDISRKKLTSTELLESIKYILKEENYKVGNASYLLSGLSVEQYQCFETADEELCLDMFRVIWNEWNDSWVGRSYEAVDQIARDVRNYWSMSNSPRIKGFNLAKLAQLAKDSNRFYAMNKMGDMLSEIVDDKETQREVLYYVSPAIIKGNLKMVDRPIPTWISHSRY